MKIFQRLLKWWRGTEPIRPAAQRIEAPSIIVEYVGDEPERPRAGVLYVVGTKGSPWKAIVICPCGCGDIIELNMAPPGRPRWQVISSAAERITLRPSVWRTAGCRSHFLIIDGEIVWATDQESN